LKDPMTLFLLALVVVGALLLGVGIVAVRYGP
jgi:hypothetical protein